ncbi:carbohydrate ABC transporter permease [Saccharothrix sp. ALI-22-I]|uniref:carbohydrate ABC transporter permease n=1 Tax=Saccharothrix sp. ALI-22-I TaxID=1933778 RepID=UPI001930ED17|nr:carbohydrate ABC transporter permease [Saccharothrix sp. ALI-22-I]
MGAKRPRGLLRHLFLLAGVVVSLFPFYWMIVMATNTTSAIYRYPPTLTIGSELWTNIAHVFEKIPFFAAMGNTIVVAVSTTVLVLFFDSLAAFTFAKFEFPGRRALFGLLIAMFMLPAQLSLIPQFLVMVQFGWAGQLQALIVPAAANAFGIFWMRQYITGAVPDELLDAARLDGCGFFRQYWHVALPVIRPGLAFLGIYTFIMAWNDYVWPLIVLVDPDRLTLQVALSQLNRSYGQDYSMIMAGALLSVLPLVIMFTVFARGFIADAVKGAVRG